MGQLAVLESVSLDGVMQAPGRPDEDPRGGFQHGGWALPYRDAVLGAAMAAGMGDTGPLLFGRRTYEDFFRIWHGRTDNPFSAVLDAADKYVVSTTLREPVPWAGSTLWSHDLAGHVARLKARSTKTILILGSGVLVRSLLEQDLVDGLTLLIHPLVLGSGQRLFPDRGPAAKLSLVDAKPTSTGVIISTYRRREP